MNIKRNWGIVRHSVAALTFTLALVGTNVAGAAAVSSSAGDTSIPVASHTVEDGQPSRNTSALETSTKWRSNSFSIAGSRDWSKLIVFTSTSINVRLPIN
jgi:hypothetical protein